VVRRRAAGYTLLELVVAMAIFGIFLLILMTLTAEMHSYEKKLPINFMKHPQVTAMVSRLRKDVLDADRVPYEKTWQEYTMGPQVLIIRTWELSGRKVVVWDFRTPREVTRRSYNVGVASDWVARGLPQDMSYLEIDAQKIEGRSWAVRLIAKDTKGRTAIDQIFVPRAHD
jgi:prepilin-type N-terminal cleavage/methylation domain-containing protein